MKFKVIKVDKITLYECENCGSRFISKEDAMAHKRAAIKNPNACR